MGKSPDLSKLAKTLTSQRLACTDEIKVLMDCMMVSRGSSSSSSSRAQASQTISASLPAMCYRPCSQQQQQQQKRVWWYRRLSLL
jgi:hypothetical protein